MLKLGLWRKLRWGLIAVGLLSIFLGVFLYCFLPPEEHNLVMLSGMIVGAGTGLLAVGVAAIVQNRRMTPEQKRQADIGCKDERNIAIQGKAYFVSGTVAAGFSLVVTFLLVGLGYRIPAYLVLGGVYVQIITLLVAERVYQKKM